MRNMKDFGTRIAEQRKKLGLTQESLALKIGITPQAVSKWENGIGYPDITLLPIISEILEMPIDELFFDKKTSGSVHKNIPKEYCSLPLICSQFNKACYSSKSVQCIDDNGTVTFNDGSYANLTEDTVCNKGEGEIRIIELDSIDIRENDDPSTHIDEELKDFHSISISNSISLDIKILKSPDGIPRIKAEGSKIVISSLIYEVANGTLSLKTKSVNDSFRSHNSTEVTIYTTFDRGHLIKCNITGNGYVFIEPDFDESQIAIIGNGDVKGNNCNTLSIKITGNGGASFKSIEGNSDFSITGNGDIEIKSSNDTSVKIAGNGDVEIGETKNLLAHIAGCGYVTSKLTGGDLNVKIAGSGEVVTSGEAQKLYCSVSGSGANLLGKDLAVKNAEIEAKDRAEVQLKSISGESIERIKTNATLIVGKRG